MSVRQRLQNVATKTGEPFQLVMERFVVERFLFRLGQSRQADLFIVKGATLFWVWSGEAHRPTRDLDMLSIGDASDQSLRAALIEICTIEAADGLTFDLESLTIEPIREDNEYGGTRAVMTTRLGSARLRFQVDVGVGDAVTPAATPQQFPSLLGMDAPTIRCYPVETVIAEKLEAIVSRGADNSRMKDFYGLFFIFETFELEGPVVAEAIKRTFGRRGTQIPSEIPYALTETFFTGQRQIRQWEAFVGKSRLADSASFATICQAIDQFSRPLFAALREGSESSDRWIDMHWIGR